MEQIPGKTKIFSIEEQTRKIAEVFGGNQHFFTVRGKAKGEFLDVAESIMTDLYGKKKAPSRGIEDLKSFYNAMAITLGKIEQLKRDGYEVAANEALDALLKPGYRMIGENKPFEECSPVTLLIFNPEITLNFMENTPPGYPRYSTEEVRDLFQSKLPSLFKWSFPEEYAEREVSRELWSLSGGLREKLTKRLAKKYDNKIEFSQSIKVTEERGKHKIYYGFCAVAYFTEKSKILRCFTKKEQSDIAFWQFKLPWSYANEHLDFGLHHETEHSYWQKLRTPFCSSGCTFGYGAIAYPNYETYHQSDLNSPKERIFIF